MSYKLGVIGAGTMAEAIVRGALRAGFLQPSDIVAADPNPERAKVWQDDMGVQCVTDNETPAGCEFLLMAVKPFLLGEVLESIAPAIGDNTVVMSVAAGILCNFIDEKLQGRGQVIRVMPNTPMMVGQGASALAAGPRTTEANLAWAQQLFAASGVAVTVNESQLDAVTGLSGSGPAYMFYLVENMIAAGIAEGLAPEIAQKLAVQTCLGAGQLLKETGESPETLRRKVTTPNGTTQRGVETMQAGGMGQAVIDGVRAAAARSREMAK